MRGIRLVFFLILLGLIGFFCISQFSAYKEVKQEISTELIGFNDNFSVTAQTRLHEVEIIFDLLGTQLLHDDVYKDPAKAAKVLSSAYELLGDHVGFGFFAPQGTPYAVSDNIDLARVRNMLEHEPTRDSFARAMTTDVMVVSRVYFFKQKQSWILPLRKAIRDRQGQVVGVVATGLILDEKIGLLDQTLGFFADQKSLLVDGSGQWRVYIHNLARPDFEHFYTTPILRKPFETAVKLLGPTQGTTVEELRTRQYSTTFVHRTQLGKGKTIFTLRYIPRYDLWAFSLLPHDSVWTVFVQRGFVSRTVIFTLAISVIVGLFLTVLRREEKSKKDLDYRAYHDALTGLGNRFSLVRMSKNWTSLNAPPFSLLFIDLDNFKNINDAFGHSCGDEILVEVAKRLQTIIPAGAQMVRHGGDEFVILIPENGATSIADMAGGIVASLSDSYQVSGMHLHIGASIGISSFPQDGTQLEALMVAADLAMRIAKRKKNSFAFYNLDLSNDMKRKVSIEYNLRRALGSNEIYMVFQPQISCGGHMQGIEALVRWDSPVLGFVAPDQFVAVAEETPLIDRLGSFIAQQSCAEFAEILRTCGDAATGMSLSINISVKQFLADEFKENFLNIIRQNGLENSQITIEITESLFIDDPDVVLSLLHDIRSSGVKVSLDDFGTGYSSLSMLRSLPIDELKIDKSFIDNICHLDQDEKMTRSIVDMGHNMNMQVVSEGVEDSHQHQALKDMGCDVFQGFYFAKPMRKDELIAFVKNHQTG